MRTEDLLQCTILASEVEIVEMAMVICPDCMSVPKIVLDLDSKMGVNDVCISSRTMHWRMINSVVCHAKCQYLLQLE